MMHGLGSMDIVGDEAVSAEVQATSLMMKNICTSKIKIHKYGEIGTEGVMYYVKNNNNQLQQPTTNNLN